MLLVRGEGWFTKCQVKLAKILKCQARWFTSNIGISAFCYPGRPRGPGTRVFFWADLKLFIKNRRFSCWKLRFRPKYRTNFPPAAPVFINHSNSLIFGGVSEKFYPGRKLALARQTAHGCHTRSSNWFRLLGGNTCALEGLSMCQLGGRRVGNEIDVDKIFMIVTMVWAVFWDNISFETQGAAGATGGK